jgi:stage II sporulation protein GA (sporulation sigma-E factor processing peptidase)
LHSVQVYLDVPLIGGLLGWIQDATLLWMVAQICGMKVILKRLILGGVVGGGFQFMLLTNQASGGLLYSWILSPLFFLIGVPCIMVFITFSPANLQRLLRVIGYFYLLAFLLSGIHWGFDSLNARFLHLRVTLFWRFWFHLTCIFLLGEVGWGIVHRKIWERVCFYPIQIDWDGCQLKLNALLDTGNRLHDPLTKVPVIIIEFNQIKDLLPKEVVSLSESFNTGEMVNDWELPGYWIERVRILPFNSLGHDHGILFGFRPDQIRVWQKQQETINKNVVVALYNRTLSQEGAFQALIPPAILNQV